MQNIVRRKYGEKNSSYCNCKFCASCISPQIRSANIRSDMPFSGYLINIMSETIYKIYRLQRQENKLVTDTNGISDAPRVGNRVSLTYFLALEYNSRVIREKPTNFGRSTHTDQ